MLKFILFIIFIVFLLQSFKQMNELHIVQTLDRLRRGESKIAENVTTIYRATPRPQSEKWTMEEVEELIRRSLKLPEGFLQAPTRTGEFTFGRHVFAFLCRNLIGAGCMDFARYTGKNHAGYYHGLKVVENELFTNSSRGKNLRKILKELNDDSLNKHL